MTRRAERGTPAVTVTRRELLKTGVTVGVGAATFAAVPHPLLAQLGGGRPEPVPPIQDPRVKELALKAVEAARTAGAAYADVRLTHTRWRDIAAWNDTGRVFDREQLVVGVRALVDGYWGFASSPVWSPDEMARLGQEAVHQAKTNALGKPRAVALAPVAAIRDGHWAMPVQRDPFEVSPFEISDHLESLLIVAGRIPRVTATSGASFWVQAKAFASTEGSYCTQRLYRSEGSVELTYRKSREEMMRGFVYGLTPAGVGWELFPGQPLRERIRALAEELREDLALPVKPVEVGRYETVCDAESVAGLVAGTLGRATELDRALGYEANAGGTSYLNDPFSMVGTYQAGAPALTVTANRSEPGGAATVQWDDDGVRPEAFTLVKDGTLADFQTTRESASWLKDYYAKQSRPVVSHGCASAPSALEAPLSHVPNLALAPGTEALDFAELVARIKKGLAIKGMVVDMDFQALNGYGRGKVYEIQQGQRVARIAGAAFLFRAPELWKALGARGGAASVRRYGLAASKGEPSQTTYHSVSAPPVVVGQLTTIDAQRKA